MEENTALNQVLHGHIVHAPKLGELVIIENGYMRLEDGKIAGISASLPQDWAKDEIVSYDDCLIMQSFCDMHLHAPQYPMLGMGMDLPLLEWLSNYTFKTEARFADTDYAREVYRRLAAELVANGTTRVCAFSSLHLESTRILMEEFEKAGICGYVGKVNMDRNGDPNLEEKTDESIRDTIAWLDGCDPKAHIQPILTPRFTPSCTNELMEALGKLAKERNLRVQSHLSENTSEIDWVVNGLHPDCDQYWESYDKYGLWKSHTVMAHCVHSDERERRAIKENNVVVAHCPDSNINLISGVAPIRQMLNEGIWITLGSDIAGGAVLPMMGVIAEAIRSSKVKRIGSNWTVDFLTVAEGYYLGTTSGAHYFGGGDGFATGDALHAVVIDDHKYVDTERLSVRERFERSFYRSNADDIKAVYSEGRKIK
ncbi:MAG: amidohydrolase family protein [Proteobacteria bacterium]|nr:amidohydrolase family protein [Pseudomonadota bacterium]